MQDQTYTKSKAVNINNDPKPYPTLNQLIEKVNDVIAQNGETLARFEKQMDIIATHKDYNESNPISGEKDIMDNNSILFVFDDKMDIVKAQANFFNSLVYRLQNIIE